MKDFEIGEAGAGNSLKARFIGPFEIIEIEDGTNTCTLRNILNNKKRRAHFAHLKIFDGNIIEEPIVIKEHPNIDHISDINNKNNLRQTSSTMNSPRRSMRLNQQTENESDATEFSKNEIQENDVDVNIPNQLQQLSNSEDTSISKNASLEPQIDQHVMSKTSPRRSIRLLNKKQS